MWTGYGWRHPGAHHDGGEVLALEAVDGELQGLVERRGHPLGEQAVQVDGAAQQLGTEEGSEEGSGVRRVDEVNVAIYHPLYEVERWEEEEMEERERL